MFLLLGTDDFTQYDKTELVSYNLHTGDMKRNLFENAKAIVGTDNSKLYLLHSSEKSAVWQYNCDNGTTEELSAELSNEANGLAWYGPKKSVISLISGKVTLFDHAEPVVKAYLPVPYNTANVTAVCSASGLYAYPYGQYVFIKDMITCNGQSRMSL